MRYPGFNTNIRHKDGVVHVQTEVFEVQDKKKIATNIYVDGRIIYASESFLGDDVVGNRDLASFMIEQQHRKIVKKFISNQLEIKGDDKKGDFNSGSIIFSDIYRNGEFFNVAKNKTFDLSEVARLLLLTD